MTQAPTATLPALQALIPGKQWVVFNQIKIPFTPNANPETGKSDPAAADNPDTWGTYNEAKKAKSRSPYFKGIGREFLKEQGITGIDLDKCIDGQGNLSDFARAIMQRLNSYTEISPSGRGLHIWVYGSLPANIAPCKPEPDGIEAYDHERYFTVTGKPYPGTPTTIEPRQAELTALYEETIVRREAARDRERPRKAESASRPGADTPYGLEALRRECDALACTGEGARNDQLNRSAYAIGQLIEGGELNENTARCELEAAAERAGLSYREIQRTLRSGIEDGMKEPRSAPESEKRTQAKPSKRAAADTGNEATPARSLLSPDGVPLPDVIIGEQLRLVTADALNALKQAEETRPSIFVQSARLVQIGRDEKKHPIIIQMEIAELKNALTRSANYYRLKKDTEANGSGWISVPVSPPKEIAEAILALNPSEWPFPALEAIVETPVMRPDGSILDTPGYDAATRLYYYPHAGMDTCKIPVAPTPENIQAALTTIDEAIGEFPYVDQADKANALALLLTPILRHAIKRHVPMALIDAPKQGTGKGLLADTVSIVATGSSLPVLTMSDSEEELQKSFTSLLMHGATIITIDNVSGRLQSKHLDAVLTADIWRGRVLGQSRMVTVAQRATWLATGNNIRLGGDLARRCYRIRLDPKVSRPWMRSNFKHPDLATWVTEHRAELIAALLTLSRAWFAADQPMSETVPALGTFTGWAKMISGILEHCGVQGFLANLEKLYEEADEESAQWEAFFVTWSAVFGGDWITTADVVEKLKLADSSADSSDSTLLNSLPEYLQIDYNESKEKNLKGFTIKLGRALEKRVDACFGNENLRLDRDKDSHTKGKKWRILADSADSSTTYAQDEKSGNFLECDSGKNHIENSTEYYPHYPQAGNRHVILNGSTSDVNGKSECTTSVDGLSASQSLSANTPIDVDTLLSQVLAVLEKQGTDKPFWRLKQNGYRSEHVTRQVYVERLRYVLTSDNDQARREAMQDIEHRLEREQA